MPVYGTQSQGMADHDSILSDRIKIDMSEVVKRVNPDVAPFTVLANMLNFEQCSSEKFEWMEADDFDAYVTTAAGFTAAATSITLIAGDYPKLTKNMVLYDKTTNQRFFVDATPTTTTLSVVPNWPTASGGSNMDAGSRLIILGTAMEYGSTPVDGVRIDPAAKYNYVQHRRRLLAKVAGRIQASALYGPTALDFDQESNMREFLKSQERTYLFGIRGRVAAATSGLDEVATTTGGIKWHMDQNSSSVATKDFNNVALTETEFDNFLEDAFKYGSSNKLAICGWNIMRIVRGWAKERIQVSEKAQSYGLNIQEYESTFGTLRFMPHKAWNNEFNMKDEMWIVDLDNIKRRGLPGRSDMHLVTTRGSSELQSEGEDATKIEVEMEDGLEIRNIETFARAYNIGS